MFGFFSLRTHKLTYCLSKRKLSWGPAKPAWIWAGPPGGSSKVFLRSFRATSQGLPKASPASTPQGLPKAFQGIPKASQEGLQSDLLRFSRRFFYRVT